MAPSPEEARVKVRCDTCHREVPEVSRVVVYIGYNRMNAKAMYNCPECFARKEKGKPYSRPIEEAPLRGTSQDENLEEAEFKESA